MKDGELKSPVSKSIAQSFPHAKVNVRQSAIDMAGPGMELEQQSFDPECPDWLYAGGGGDDWK